MSIIKSSRLLKAAALLEYPTTPVTKKLIRTFVVVPLIKVDSKYGESGTRQMLGLVITSGIPLYTFAAMVESAFLSGVRIADSMLIGTSFRHPKTDLKDR